MQLYEFKIGSVCAPRRNPEGKVKIVGFCSQLKADGKELPARREMVIYECRLGIVKNNIAYFRRVYKEIENEILA
jgi:hypothetical protein